MLGDAGTIRVRPKCFTLSTPTGIEGAQGRFCCAPRESGQRRVYAPNGCIEFRARRSLAKPASGSRKSFESAQLQIAQTHFVCICGEQRTTVAIYSFPIEGDLQYFVELGDGAFVEYEKPPPYFGGSS